MRDNKVMDKFLKVVAEAGFQQDEPLDMSNSKHRNKLFVWILKRQQFGNAKLFEHLNEISPREKIIEGFKFFGIFVSNSVLKGTGSDQEEEEFLESLISLTNALTKCTESKMNTKIEDMDVILGSEFMKKSPKRSENEDESDENMETDDDSLIVATTRSSQPDNTKFANLESKLGIIDEECKRFDLIAVENTNPLVDRSTVIDNCLSGIGNNFDAANQMIKQRQTLETETAKLTFDHNDVAIHLDSLGQFVEIVADETSQVVNFLRLTESN